MFTTIIIAILTCLTLILSVLFFPRIKLKKIELNTYWIVCLIGTLLLIIFGSISLKEIYDSLTVNSSINPLKILILFFSMTLLSVFLDEVGFFKYLATKAAYISKSNQIVLFIMLYFLTSILTIFTSNDIVILTFTPFICYFCKNAKIDPTPYLVSEFAAANTWSMMLIIGNPTNIYLATSMNIGFIDYLKVMVLPTLVAGIVEIIIIYLLLRNKLKPPLKINIEEAKPNDKLLLSIGLSHLLVCLVLLVISSYLSFDMWLISLICALSLIICTIIISLFRKNVITKLQKTLKRLPYSLIPFVISMFIIVATINKHGIAEFISNLLGEKHVIFTYGLSSFFAANIINNIPMSVLFSTLPNMADPLDNMRAIYATIIGSNLGAFLTPIGALAGIMFTQLLAKYKVNYNFKTFIRYGFIIALPTLLISLLMLYII